MVYAARQSFGDGPEARLLSPWLLKDHQKGVRRPGDGCNTPDGCPYVHPHSPCPTHPIDVANRHLIKAA